MTNITNAAAAAAAASKLSHYVPGETLTGEGG